MRRGGGTNRSRQTSTPNPSALGGASARRALAHTWSQLPALTQVLVTFGFAAMGCVAFAAADQLLGTRSMSKDSLHPVLLGSGIILSLVLGSAAFHVRKRSMQARAIADSKRELEQILAAATRVAIIATDRDGVIRQFNTGAEWMLGFAAEGVIGRQTPVVFHLPSELKIRAEEIARATGGRPSEFGILVADAESRDAGERHWSLRCRDGGSIRASVATTALRDAADRVVGYLFVARDVTRELNALAALQEAKHAAEQANETKSQFVANISHEIRTPMTAILGYADLLEDEGLDGTTRLEHVRTIRRNGDHLLAIINDILDMERIASGKLPIEIVESSMREVVGEVVDLMRVRANAKGLSVEVRHEASLPERLRTDPMRVRQVLVNLLGNAIKFTEQGGVSLTIGEAFEGSRRMLAIRVADTGPGIRVEQLDRIFEPFTQADSSSARRHGGSGLGLAISRRLAHMLGGDLKARSVVGEGSVFTLTLPLEGASRGEVTTLPGSMQPSMPAAAIRTPPSPAPAKAAVATPRPVPATSATPEPKPTPRPRRRGLEALLDEIAASPTGGSTSAVDAESTTPPPQVASPEAGEPSIPMPPMATSTASTSTPHAPISRTTPHPPMPQPSRFGPLHGCRILLVEDGPDNRRLLAFHLVRAGAEVATCEDGQQAVDRLRREGFDRACELVLMDMQMPGLDGYDATRQLRAMGFRRPIIALTAHASTNDRERCLACGCDDYASKPIDAKALAALCARWRSTATAAAA